MFEHKGAFALVLMVGGIAMAAMQLLELFWVERLEGRVLACHPDERVSSSPQAGLPATRTVRMTLEAALTAGPDSGAAEMGDEVKVRVPTSQPWTGACPVGRSVVFLRPRLQAGALRLDGEGIDWGERFGLPLVMVMASVALGAVARISDRKVQR